MEKKKIVNYCGECFAILLPVYYECEDKPAWCVVFKGSKEECKNKIELYPEYAAATYEENLQNRKDKMQEYLFLLSIKKIKEAEKIKKLLIFNFSLSVQAVGRVQRPAADFAFWQIIK